MLKFCICVAILIAVASPAAANWQYTAWGMTPDQVTAATHGNVLSVDPSTRSSVDGDRWRWKRHSAVGDFHFTADFRGSIARTVWTVHLFCKVAMFMAGVARQARNMAIK